ncbi:tetratricopeptide repeat protein, partial [Striga asiatica]
MIIVNSTSFRHWYLRFWYWYVEIFSNLECTFIPTGFASACWTRPAIAIGIFGSKISSRFTGNPRPPLSSVGSFSLLSPGILSIGTYSLLSPGIPQLRKKNPRWIIRNQVMSGFFVHNLRHESDADDLCGEDKLKVVVDKEGKLKVVVDKDELELFEHELIKGDVDMSYLKDFWPNVFLRVTDLDFSNWFIQFYKHGDILINFCAKQLNDLLMPILRVIPRVKLYHHRGSLLLHVREIHVPFSASGELLHTVSGDLNYKKMVPDVKRFHKNVQYHTPNPAEMEMAKTRSLRREEAAKRKLPEVPKRLKKASKAQLPKVPKSSTPKVPAAELKLFEITLIRGGISLSLLMDYWPNTFLDLNAYVEFLYEWYEHWCLQHSKHRGDICSRPVDYLLGTKELHDKVIRDLNLLPHDKVMSLSWFKSFFKFDCALMLYNYRGSIILRVREILIPFSVSGELIKTVVSAGVQCKVDDDGWKVLKNAGLTESLEDTADPPTFDPSDRLLLK